VVLPWAKPPFLLGKSSMVHGPWSIVKPFIHLTIALPCRAYFLTSDNSPFTTMTEYFKIGKLVSAFGLQGELVLKHNLGKKTSLKGLAALFIEERNNSFIPYFIESTRIKNEEEIYLKVQDIPTREAAVKLTQKEVWLPETDFKKFSAKTAPINLLGYTIEENKKELGTILEVIEQPHQILCSIDIGGKEVYIPLNESTILRIDHKGRRVVVELPEGLLEIYL
jgi:16S rRNA processing protein RimM